MYQVSEDQNKGFLKGDISLERILECAVGSPNVSSTSNLRFVTNEYFLLFPRSPNCLKNYRRKKALKITI